MSIHNDTIGSIWRRWDLHIHAPGTKLADAYGGKDAGTEQIKDETWKAYLQTLEDSEVQVFGITDYFCFDSYFEVVRRYKEQFPEGTKVFLPNIEFRLSDNISEDGTHVHAHVLFDNDLEVSSQDNFTAFLTELKTHKTKGNVKVSCNSLKDGDFDSATISMAGLQEALAEVFGDTGNYIIVTAANNDGLRMVNKKSNRSLSISDELDKASGAFFGSPKNAEYFLETDRYEGEEESEPKPVYSGSDAHSFDELKRLSGDEPDFPPTWIKADKTFRGLRQTLFEPEARVFIGERPEVLVRQSREATRFISRLEVAPVPEYDGENGTWFDNVSISFNPELTAIIGNKGSGKSAVADIIALLADSRQEKHFSFLANDRDNRKFRSPGYAENFEGHLYWKNGAIATQTLDQSIDLSNPEGVKYLPQNYFESLTNEIEVNAFRREIEDVVFSHVDESDRMGKSSFAELEEFKTLQAKQDISTLKARLRELNIEIVDLESRADPAFKRSIQAKLKSKEREHYALEKSKPKEVPKPDDETDKQKKVNEALDKKNSLVSDLVSKGKEAVDKLSDLKLTLQKLATFKESVSGLSSHLAAQQGEIEAQCKELGLDASSILKYKIDVSSIDKKVHSVSAEIELLESDSKPSFGDDTDYQKLSSIPDLRAAHSFVFGQIKELKETLSAPHRRHQSYIQAVNEIEAKQQELMGDEQSPKPDTINYLKRQLSYIENELKQQINAKTDARDKTSREIFAAKTKVRSFYEGLKERVGTRLADINTDDFTVTIEASFVPSGSFAEDFFQFVNQGVKGEFRGNVEGGKKLQGIMSGVDWNDVDSILQFIREIVEQLKKQPLEAQVKDIKKLYDFLFSFEFFDAKYELRLGGKNLNQLSPGEKGLLLLVFYLHLDKEKTPLIIDQPEDNLDNDSIFTVLAKCIREAKKTRQVILVTHNPNLAVGADAEQVLYVRLEKHKNYKFSYESGAIEKPQINDHIVKVLEGSRPAFVQRRLKYQIS